MSKRHSEQSRCPPRLKETVKEALRLGWDACLTCPAERRRAKQTQDSRGDVSHGALGHLCVLTMETEEVASHLSRIVVAFCITAHISGCRTSEQTCAWSSMEDCCVPVTFQVNFYMSRQGPVALYSRSAGKNLWKY